MARVILRDDDLSFRSSVEDLEPFFKAATYYDEVVLSFVPFPEHHSKLGPNKFSTYNTLLDNTELCEAVKKLISLNNVRIGMHGVRHSGYGEFSQSVPVTEISRGKKYLEEAFGVPVDTFTPPNNILSKENYFRLHQAGFKRIISAFSNWPHERPLTKDYILHFLKSAALALIKKRQNRVLGGVVFNGIYEIPSFVAYRESDLSLLIDSIIQSGGCSGCDVVIATHYWELWQTCPEALLKIPSRLREECL